MKNTIKLLIIVIIIINSNISILIANENIKRLSDLCYIHKFFDSLDNINIITQNQKIENNKNINLINENDIKEINRISNLIIKFNNLNKNQIKNIIKKSFINIGFVKGINAIDKARILFVPYCDLKNETIAKAQDSLNDTSNFYKLINFDTLPGVLKGIALFIDIENHIRLIIEFSNVNFFKDHPIIDKKEFFSEDSIAIFFNTSVNNNYIVCRGTKGDFDIKYYDTLDSLLPFCVPYYSSDFAGFSLGSSNLKPFIIFDNKILEFQILYKLKIKINDLKKVDSASFSKYELKNILKKELLIYEKNK